MRLELGSIHVKGIQWGYSTRLENGVLTLDRDEIEGLVLQDPQIRGAVLEIATPGDSTRIINSADMVEPRVKIRGGGTTYPGLQGRTADQVGSGRTHRLAGMAVTTCLDVMGTGESQAGEARTWSRDDQGPVASGWPQGTDEHFIDMSGPGAVTPYAALHNLCLVIEAPHGVTADEQHGAAQAAAFRVTDRLAETARDAMPDDVETFEIEPRPDLPGVVFIPHLSSTEPQVGPRGSFGIAVYGQVRLSAPWLLEPTELMDGAIAGGGHTWIMANNPLVLDLARRHGRDLNFLGCIIQRTNWTNQREYGLAAHRAATLASKLGAQGAIITTDVRGQRWVGTMLTVQECESRGIDVVLLTEEEDNENGAAPALLFAPPELKSVVTNGTGDVAGGFPAVTNVIGSIGEPLAAWRGELPPIHGRYGIAHVTDWYGIGSQSYADF